jgi:hypothetical protein
VNVNPQLEERISHSDDGNNKNNSNNTSDEESDDGDYVKGSGAVLTALPFKETNSITTAISVDAINVNIKKALDGAEPSEPRGGTTSTGVFNLNHTVYTSNGELANSVNPASITAATPSELSINTRPSGLQLSIDGSAIGGHKSAMFLSGSPLEVIDPQVCSSGFIGASIDNIRSSSSNIGSSIW